MTTENRNGINGTKRNHISVLDIYTSGLTSECCKFIPLVP